MNDESQSNTGFEDISMSGGADDPAEGAGEKVPDAEEQSAPTEEQQEVTDIKEGAESAQGEPKPQENPFEAVGSWFQGLVGGKQELRQRNSSNEVAEETDAENPAEPHESKKEVSPPEEFQDEDVEESRKKKGGARQRIQAIWSFVIKNRLLHIIIAAHVVILLAIALIVPAVYSNTKSRKFDKAIKSTGKVDTLLTAHLVKHPLYTGELFPYGSVSLRFDTSNTTLAVIKAEGLEEKCDRCSWWVTGGDSCHDVNRVNVSPFYVRRNPWGGTFYSTHEGVTLAVQKIFNGYGVDDMAGKAVMLNAQDGSPLACGVFKKRDHPTVHKRLWANIQNLPAYDRTGRQVEGKIRMDFYPDKSFYFAFDFSGLPQCTNCMLGVHIGTSCNENPGENFWNDEILGYNPWTQRNSQNSASYSSDVNGTVAFRHGFYLMDGYDANEHIGHIVIVADSSGANIACGELHESINYVWDKVTASMNAGLQAGAIVSSGD
jgi:hypothetical protein